MLVLLTLCVYRLTLAAPMPWALEYEGQSQKSQGFLYDRKAVRLISADLGIGPGSRAMRAFHGVPTAVSVIDRRFVWSSSCEAHECPYIRGFFWLDSDSGESLVARVAVLFLKEQEYRDHHILTEHTVLTIGGSAPSANAIPPEAMKAMRSWIRANGLRFDAVYYRTAAGSHSSRRTPLPASQFSALLDSEEQGS